MIGMNWYSEVIFHFSFFIIITSSSSSNHYLHIKSQTVHWTRIPRVLNLRHLHRHRLHIHKLLRGDFHTVIPNSQICRATHKVVTFANMQVAKLHTGNSGSDGEFTRVLSTRLAGHSDVVNSSYVETSVGSMNAPLLQTVGEQLRGLANIPFTIIE